MDHAYILEGKLDILLTHRTGLYERVTVTHALYERVTVTHGLPHKNKVVGIAGEVEVLHDNPIGTFWDLQLYGRIGTHVHVRIFRETNHVVL